MGLMVAANSTVAGTRVPTVGKRQTSKSSTSVKLNTALHAKLISEGTFNPTSLESFRAKIRSNRVG